MRNKYNIPSFIIIGAQKSGTSSLFYYLDQHPLLCGSKEKELEYFSQQNIYKLGDRWYASNFETERMATHPFLFEATTEYLYIKETPERIYHYNPQIKLIVILRDPIKRAFSAWNMFRHVRTEAQKLTKLQLENAPYNKKRALDYLLSLEKYPTFNQAVKEDIHRYLNHSEEVEPSFIRRGIYHEQLERYLNIFPENQLLILGYKDLIEDTVNTLNRILLFLNLPQSNWAFLDKQIKNKGKYNSLMDVETVQLLAEFYEEHNEKTFKILGEKINW